MPHDTNSGKRAVRGHAYAPGLKAYRAARGGTAEAEAEAAGVSWRTWMRWEGLEGQAPLWRLEGVAERWGVAVDVLLAEAEPGPDAEVRRVVEEHGEAAFLVAAKRVVGAL